MSANVQWDIGHGAQSVGIPFSQRHELTDKVRDTAPGLTLAALDGLLKDAYAAGHREGRTSGRAEGFRDGFNRGSEDAWMKVRGRMQKILNGQLYHNVRRLRERDGRRKTTIAEERRWIASEADSLGKAVKDICDATGCQ